MCYQKQIDEGLAIISDAISIADQHIDRYSHVGIRIHQSCMTDHQPHHSLTNEDLAVPVSGVPGIPGIYAALWISMSLCIPTYMLASS